MNPLPPPNHVYLCKWHNEDRIFTNVVTSIDTYVRGYCLNDREYDRIDHQIDWDLAVWTDQQNSITDLGHIDDLPELFI